MIWNFGLGCGILLLFQLDEHAVRGRGMNEGDQRAFGTRPRLLVHEAHAARFQPFGSDLPFGAVLTLLFLRRCRGWRGAGGLNDAVLHQHGPEIRMGPAIFSKAAD